MITPIRYGEQACGSGSVAAIWRLEVSENAGSLAPYPVRPDGCVDLLLPYRWRRQRMVPQPLLIAGPATRTQHVSVRHGDGFVGIRFRPGWGGFALGVRPADLRDRDVPAASIGGTLIDLESRIAECRHPREAVAIMATAAAQRASRHAPLPRLRAALRLMEASQGRLPVEAVAARLSVTARTLRRDIIASVGLSPKTLARIIRFRHALRLLRDNNPASLSAVAAMTGYADQAHMTRDFSALGSLSPGSA